MAPQASASELEMPLQEPEDEEWAFSPLSPLPWISEPACFRQVAEVSEVPAQVVSPAACLEAAE